MVADHLSARQRAGPWLGQHSLSTLTGLAYVSPGMLADDNCALSQVCLPRHLGLWGYNNQAGVYLFDVQVNVPMVANNLANGLTLECVYATSVRGFNFFGNVWNRAICRVTGYYGYHVTIELAPTWDSINDTTGRASVYVSDVGGTWVVSKDIHSRPVLNDGTPHHLAVRYEGSKTYLYVDGMLVETTTLGGPVSDLEPNKLIAGVEAYFTQPEGSVSHLCASALIPVQEVVARSRLAACTLAGGPLPESVRTLAWSEDRAAWIPVKGYSTALSAWKPIY